MKKTTKKKQRTTSKTSKKTVKKKANPRNNVNFLLSNGELAAVKYHKDLLSAQQGGIELKLGTYAKHAVLDFPRLRRIEQEYSELAKRIARPLIPATMESLTSDAQVGDVASVEPTSAPFEEDKPSDVGWGESPTPEDIEASR